MRTIKIPSKVILIGEYGVLEAGKALVATHAPYFRFVAEPKTKSGILGLSEEGPAVWYLEKEKPVLKHGWRFEDPHEMRGGLGASSAQFLGTVAICEGLEVAKNTTEMHTLYRKIHSHEETPPSGADLVAQIHGGISVFDAKEIEVKSANWSEDYSGAILVFSATDHPGRKTVTHSHLAELRARATRSREWKAIAERGIMAFEEGRLEEFGLSLVWFARSLSMSGLECDPSRYDREAFCKITGVFGAKGCGAMLSDTVIVVLDPKHPSAKEEVLELAKMRGLRFLCELSPETPGVTEAPT